MSRYWMPFYWGDYFRDTRHLTKLQHASYLMLIGHYWMHGGLPEDDRQLATITMSTPRQWKRDKPVLQAFFHDGWKHKRIETELRRHAEKIARAKERGQKGGLVSSMRREVNRYKTTRIK